MEFLGPNTDKITEGLLVPGRQMNSLWQSGPAHEAYIKVRLLVFWGPEGLLWFCL